MEFGLPLTDNAEGIRIDPTFVECYLHKDHALMAMKDFSQAMTAFNKALEIHPNNQEAMKGYQQCTVGLSHDSEQVCKRALVDSEIQQILDDLTQPHRQKLHRQVQRQKLHRQAQRQLAQPHRQAQRQRAQPRTV
ncbi:unnamed protein product [Rotaria sordida]|uniref:Uncharacterized protein n=1 Tax=Rotaria sordida TaxID=392033 RepID=A0A819JB39_9BILA|nr:unnamed protein product [Rotaria sordida]